MSPAPSSPRPLEGQVALVTGASRGIGRAIAERLGAAGAEVIVNYRGDETAARESLEGALAAGAPGGYLLQADVGRPDEARGLVESTLARSGRLDVVINNAGIQTSSMLHRMSDEDWQRVIDVNLSGVFHVSRAALRHMREMGAGQILNVASASSFVAQVGAASYVASKHGLIGLTKAMAMENAPRGIRVNAVAPGLTETDMVGHLDAPQRASLEKLVPMGRAGQPQEVAEMVVFVLGSATYSSGNVFHVSGGVVMG